MTRQDRYELHLQEAKRHELAGKLPEAIAMLTIARRWTNDGDEMTHLDLWHNRLHREFLKSLPGNRLKVYGWTTMVRRRGRHVQARMILAAKSLAATKATAGDFWPGRDHISTTDNNVEVSMALSNPGVLLWHVLDDCDAMLQALNPRKES